ncbi:hypothetical protein QAD02_011919 [Eretmocerus hayati]|uniref:Uncharacterized protein n=1 Tax=Eretmocerus hayati TaxID=131215 RepID=A0ACC2NY36_9HYME|nr:hypothetical protein QAD02_011919 [Eretmocerus hayati]
MMACKFCGQLIEDANGLVLHMKNYHPKREHLDLPCGESNCSKVFQTFGSRSLHITRHHRKFVKSDRPNETQTIEDDSRDNNQCRNLARSRPVEVNSEHAEVFMQHRKRRNTSLSEAPDPPNIGSISNDTLLSQKRPRLDNEDLEDFESQEPNNGTRLSQKKRKRSLHSEICEIPDSESTIDGYVPPQSKPRIIDENSLKERILHCPDESAPLNNKISDSDSDISHTRAVKLAADRYQVVESSVRVEREDLGPNGQLGPLIPRTLVQYHGKREHGLITTESHLFSSDFMTLNDLPSTSTSCLKNNQSASEPETKLQQANISHPCDSLIHVVRVSDSENSNAIFYDHLSGKTRFPAETANINSNSCHADNTTNSVMAQDRKRDLAFNLILNLRARNTPESTIKSIIKSFDELIKCNVQEILGEINDALLQHGINLSKYVDIPKQIGRCAENFKDFDSKYKQDKYIRGMDSFVGPKRIPLDPVVKKGKQTQIGVNRPLQVQCEQLMYISIVDIIVSFMKNPLYRQLLESVESSNPAILKRFSDGSNFKNNKLLLKSLDGYLTVPIFLYYDDVNLTDTASNRPTKMAMFYFTSGNLRASHRSSTKFIYLVLSVEQDIFKTYPLASILECIVKDLQKLENGVQLSDGSIIYGTLAAFLGDNLASHKIGGFKTGFTEEHPCRVCMATLQIIRRMIKEDPKLLRTVPEYDEMIRKLQNCNTAAEYDRLSKEFGLNEDCPLNALQHFHGVYGIPPDIFHDIFEGSSALTLHPLLNHFLKGPDKVMNLDDFNSKMMDFDFGYSETKPSRIFPQHLDENAKLHQTGIQMWSLAIITPLILGPRVPLQDPFWENYTSLLEITMLICGYSISMRMTGYLQIQIETYLRTFQELYERHLIPKQHFLLHYVTYILRFGPLYIYITLRMEAKHQFFKEMMRRLKNLKNPSVTMAEQHQWYQIHVSEGFLDEDEVGPLRESTVADLPFAHILPKDQIKVHEMTCLSSDGIKFVSGQCFVMTKYEDITPEFSLVESILVLNKSPVFACRKAKTVEFDFHYFAYNIEMTEEYELISPEHLSCPAVFHVHHVDGKQFIMVKRAVGDIY